MLLLFSFTNTAWWEHAGVPHRELVLTSISEPLIALACTVREKRKAWGWVRSLALVTFVEDFLLFLNKSTAGWLTDKGPQRA